MGDLLVECPIHLDAVSIRDIHVFKCGHGFCEPCLEGHYAHHRHSGIPLTCPTCRQPIKRSDTFSLFLTLAQPGATPSSQLATADAPHARLTRELKEMEAAHANCSRQFVDLQNEIDALNRQGVQHNQTIQHLRNRSELLEERVAREADNSVRLREEKNQLREEVAKLQAENYKTTKSLDEALREVQTHSERVKEFQGYVQKYKHQCSLEKKKRKAIEDANRHLKPKKEEDSLVVVDANAPDTLCQHGPGFGWLDEACRVKGDQLAVASDEDVNMEFEVESGDEAQHVDHDIFKAKGKRREDQAPMPFLKFNSDWNLERETLVKPFRKRNKQVGGSKLVRVRLPAGTGTHELAGDPSLAIDIHGRVKGTVTLGSRQKLNSKN